MKLLNLIKGYLTTFIALAGVFYIFLSDAIIEPTIKESGSASVRQIEPFGKLICVIFLVLLIYPLRKFCKSRQRGAWWLASLGFIIIAFSAYWFYFKARGSAIIYSKMHNQYFIAGNDLRPEVDSAIVIARLKEPSKKWTKAELIEQFGDGPEDIWTEASIMSNERGLFFLFAIMMTFFLLGIISGIHAGFGLINNTEITSPGTE